MKSLKKKKKVKSLKKDKNSLVVQRSGLSTVTTGTWALLGGTKISQALQNAPFKDTQICVLKYYF